MDASVNFSGTRNNLQGTTPWSSFHSAKQFVVTQTNHLIQTTCDIAQENFSFYKPNKAHPPSFISSSFFASRSIFFLTTGCGSKLTSLCLSALGFNQISRTTNTYSKSALAKFSKNMQEAKDSFPIQFKEREVTPLERFGSAFTGTRVKNSSKDEMIESISELFKAVNDYLDSNVKKPLNNFMFSVTHHPYFSDSAK